MISPFCLEFQAALFPNGINCFTCYFHPSLPKSGTKEKPSYSSRMWSLADFFGDFDHGLSSSVTYWNHQYSAHFQLLY